MVLNEFYRIAFRKKIYNTLEQLQYDLDEWINYYNQDRVHSGKHCYGKMPMQTFIDSRRIDRLVLSDRLNLQTKLSVR